MNEYNKGFIVNFYYLIGPSLFHIFFPIYKCFNYDIIENYPIMLKNKCFSGIELIRYLYKENKNNGQEIYKQELKNMDPNEYLEQSKEFYKDKIIV